MIAPRRRSPRIWHGQDASGRRSRFALRLIEREEISRGLVTKHSLRSITRTVKRSPSTISREVRRKSGRQSVITALINQARKLPKDLYRSPTWGRGSEMAGRRKFTMATNIDVHFCDPQSPWQRGSNENTNRLLRQYVPEGIDISGFSQTKLSAIARQLNERPRKTLQYQTPAREV